MTSRRSPRNKNTFPVRKFDFSKTDRIKGKQVKILFSKGKRFCRGCLTLIYLPSQKQAVGLVASRKVGSAVKRNKVKRIIREAYRMNKEIFKGMQVIFYTQKTITYQEVVDIFKQFEQQ